MGDPQVTIVMDLNDLDDLGWKIRFQIKNWSCSGSRLVNLPEGNKLM